MQSKVNKGESVGTFNVIYARTTAPQRNSVLFYLLSYVYYLLLAFNKCRVYISLCEDFMIAALLETLVQ